MTRLVCKPTFRFPIGLTSPLHKWPGWGQDDECNCLWLLKNPFSVLVPKTRRARMRYKRLSLFHIRFWSPEFGRFCRMKDFFNSYACLQQLAIFRTMALWNGVVQSTDRVHTDSRSFAFILHRESAQVSILCLTQTNRMNLALRACATLAKASVSTPVPMNRYGCARPVTTKSRRAVQADQFVMAI
jgi:hypothetical protein